MAVLGGDRRADQPPVVGQHLRIPLPQRLDQPRRPLNIGKQERDRPARKPTHARPPQPLPGTHQPSQDPAIATTTPAPAVTRAPDTPGDGSHARHAAPQLADTLFTARTTTTASRDKASLA